MKVKKKKAINYILILTTITIILVSCGSRRTFETLSPERKFANYEIVEIPDFKSDIPNSPPELQWQLANQFAKKLRQERTFSGVSRSPVEANSAGVMLIEGTIISIQPPEWYKQVVKTTKIVIGVRFIDKQEEVVIAEARFEGSSKMGLISGGIILGSGGRAIDEIIAYLNSNYSIIK